MKTVTCLLVLLLAAWGGGLPIALAQSCAAPTNSSASSPTASTLVVSFSPVASVSQYVVRYYWAGDSTAAGIGQQLTPTSPLTLTGLRAASTYVVLVGSICGNGTTVYAPRRLFVTSSGSTAACAPVSNVQVSGITTTGAAVSFTPASGASSYTISYYAVGDSLNTHTLVTSSPSLTLSGLAAGTAYRLRIQSNCGPGVASVPVLVGFRTLATTVPCGAVSNVVLTASSASTATVSFTPGAGNTSFVITYHLANDTTRRVTTSASPATITGLVPGQTYYVQVVSQCGTGVSVVYTNSGSIAYGFRGAGALSVRNTLGAGTLDAYPSPAHEVLNLSLPAVPGASQAQVTLLNTLGQPVKTRELKLTSSGAQTQLDLEGVRPGLYTLRVVAGEQQASQRVLVE
jgi:phage terminase large subunit-like protein